MEVRRAEGTQAPVVQPRNLPARGGWVSIWEIYQFWRRLLRGLRQSRRDQEAARPPRFAASQRNCVGWRRAGVWPERNSTDPRLWIAAGRPGRGRIARESFRSRRDQRAW